MTSAPELAGIFSGRTLHSALLISCPIDPETLPHKKHGASGLALNILPSGAIKVIGRLNPSFKGNSGLVNAFTVVLTEDKDVTHKPFSGPRCCGSEPVRSTVISLPLIVIVTLILTGVSKSIPLLSIWSSAVQVPSGIFSIANLVM